MILFRGPGHSAPSDGLAGGTGDPSPRLGETGCAARMTCTLSIDAAQHKRDDDIDLIDVQHLDEPTWAIQSCRADLRANWSRALDFPRQRHDHLATATPTVLVARPNTPPAGLRPTNYANIPGKKYPPDPNGRSSRPLCPIKV
jgi:hypothetical protein